MTPDKKDELKSAFDLAMERMPGGSGDAAPLSDTQRVALSEINARVRADIAETEILMGQRLAEAREAGDAAKMAQTELAKNDSIQEIRHQGETDKERIRSGGA
jgi:hypothetical protein